MCVAQTWIFFCRVLSLIFFFFFWILLWKESPEKFFSPRRFDMGVVCRRFWAAAAKLGFCLFLLPTRHFSKPPAASSCRMLSSRRRRAAGHPQTASWTGLMLGPSQDCWSWDRSLVFKPTNRNMLANVSRSFKEKQNHNGKCSLNLFFSVKKMLKFSFV